MKDSTTSNYSGELEGEPIVTKEIKEPSLQANKNKKRTSKSPAKKKISAETRLVDSSGEPQTDIILKAPEEDNSKEIPTENSEKVGASNKTKNKKGRKKKEKKKKAGKKKTKKDKDKKKAKAKKKGKKKKKAKKENKGNKGKKGKKAKNKSKKPKN